MKRDLAFGKIWGQQGSRGRGEARWRWEEGKWGEVLCADSAMLLCYALERLTFDGPAVCGLNDSAILDLMIQSEGTVYKPGLRKIRRCLCVCGLSRWVMGPC